MTPKPTSSRRRPRPKQRSVVLKSLVWLFTALLAFAAPATLPVSAQDHLDPTTGYRIGQYRAPTPPLAPGGTTISLETLQQLVSDQRAILLDVMPSDGAGPDPVTGKWRLMKPRSNLAGSVWLPDIGRGTLTPTQEVYFKTNLTRLTNADFTRPIIIYCQADCWMSWNAIKRAASYGYTALYWYPDGTDGMRDWDIPLVPSTPVPMEPSPN